MHGRACLRCAKPQILLQENPFCCQVVRNYQESDLAHGSSHDGNGCLSVKRNASGGRRLRIGSQVHREHSGVCQDYPREVGLRD